MSRPIRRCARLVYSASGLAAGMLVLIVVSRFVLDWLAVRTIAHYFGR